MVAFRDDVQHAGPGTRPPPHTLDTRNNLAYWQGVAGDPAGAVTTFEQLLAEQLRVLGPDHPNILTTHADLASWRRKACDQMGSN